MESDNKRIKLKLSIVAIFRNQDFSPFEDGFTSILLDGPTVPSIIVEELPIEGVTSLVNTFFSNYVKYDTSILTSKIVDCFQDEECLELIFCFNLIFISGVISNGSLMSKKDLADRKIDIDGRYRRYL